MQREENDIFCQFVVVSYKHVEEGNDLALYTVERSHCYYLGSHVVVVVVDRYSYVHLVGNRS